MKRKGSDCPNFERPEQALVQEAIDQPEKWFRLVRIPTRNPDEWQRDHSAFFIACVFPTLDMPLSLRRVAVEAYLTKGFEQWCDGSSVVPDTCTYGNTKDWQGVMHDYTFWLHHKGYADAFGYTWGYWASNNAYRRAWLADGRYIRSVLWWLGLNIGSWPVWLGLV